MALAPSLCKWNKIINFVPSVKLQKIIFCRTPKKRIFSMQIVFFTFYRKSLETNYVWDHMIHIFCLECFYLGWIIFFFCHRSGVITFLEEVKKLPNYPSLTGPLQQQFIHCSQWEDIIIKQCIYNQRMRQKKTIKK